VRTEADRGEYLERLNRCYELLAPNYFERIGPWPTTDNSVQSPSSFQAWLTLVGVRHFRAQRLDGTLGEATRPHHADVAATHGLKHMTPPPWMWPWAGLVLLVGDFMRIALGRPVTLRNLWREKRYNADPKVGGAERSDHIWACGGDYDFLSQHDRCIGEGVARGLYVLVPELELSLGHGARSLHVGILTPKGSRGPWKYGDVHERRIPLGTREAA